MALVVKDPLVNAGDLRDTSLILESGAVRNVPLEEGMATQSSISCLENSMDRRAWRAAVYRVSKSQTLLKQFSTYARKVKETDPTWSQNQLCPVT